MEEFQCNSRFAQNLHLWSVKIKFQKLHYWLCFWNITAVQINDSWVTSSLNRWWCCSSRSLCQSAVLSPNGYIKKRAVCRAYRRVPYHSDINKIVEFPTTSLLACQASYIHWCMYIYWCMYISHSILARWEFGLWYDTGKEMIVVIKELNLYIPCRLKYHNSLIQIIILTNTYTNQSYKMFCYAYLL